MSRCCGNRLLSIIRINLIIFREFSKGKKAALRASKFPITGTTLTLKNIIVNPLQNNCKFHCKKTPFE